jgi:hypothetical protein
VWQEIVNLVGLGAKNQYCDCPSDKTLFVREAFVDRQENFKTARFRDRESSPFSLPARPASGTVWQW